MKPLTILALAIFIAAFNLQVFSQTKITGIQAKLFYNEKGSQEDKDYSGTFSESIFDTPDFALWNVIIGAGSAKGNSNQAIVIVEISSNGQSNKKQLLKFTAMSGGKVISQQQRTFSCVNEQSKYKILFVLNDTGCTPVKIKAEIVQNSKPVSTLNKSIDFKCGE